MTPEAQRIAIAEACGWKYPTDLLGLAMSAAYPEQMIPPGEASKNTNAIPDYLNDLNACHEMEKALTDEQDREYRGKLVEVCGSLADALCATAAQRAEAFLRTLNLWHETR